jgi:hypothetical protein
MVGQIPPRRRDLVFAEIKRIVSETEAVDRSLEGIGEAMALDEALEQIADLLGAEVRLAQKLQAHVKVA